MPRRQPPPAPAPSSLPETEPPAPHPASTGEVQGDFYRVCSYNVRNWCVTDRQVDGKYEKAAPKPEAEKKAVLSILSQINPDILAVEEMGADPAMSQDFIQALSQAGLDYPHTFHAVGRDARISILLLSRYPIASSEAVQEVQENNQSIGSLPGRPFAHATITVNESYPLEIIAAHLKSKRQTENGPSEEELRVGEARALRGLVQQRLAAHPDANLLVVGDMNDFWQSPTLKTLMGDPHASGFRLYDLWLRDYLGDRWTHFYSPEQSYARLDYMFASQGLFREYVAEQSYIYRETRGAPASQQWANASDHRPIIATFHAQEQGGRN